MRLVFIIFGFTIINLCNIRIRKILIFVTVYYLCTVGHKCGRPHLWPYGLSSFARHDSTSSIFLCIYFMTVTNSLLIIYVTNFARSPITSTDLLNLALFLISINLWVSK